MKSTIKILFIVLLITSVVACRSIDEDEQSKSQIVIDESSSTSLKNDNSASAYESVQSFSSESLSVSSSVDDVPSENPKPQFDITDGEMEKQNSQHYDKYQKMLAEATDLENYLRSTLLAKDYGGIYIWQHETVTLDIWVVDRDAVESALKSYSGKPFQPNLKKAKCSIEDMTNFSEVLNTIKLRDEEVLNVYLSQMDNSIIVNISKIGDKRLEQEINSLVQTNHIPPECVVIFIIDPTGENPVT